MLRCPLRSVQMLRLGCARYASRFSQRGFIGGILGGSALLGGGAAAATGLLGLGGSLLGQSSANSANMEMLQSAQNFNAQQVQQQEAFQKAQTTSAEAYNTQMADTSEQRRVADLKKAGLNPMLAGVNQQGAPSPTISAPSGGAASSPQPIPSRTDYGAAISNAVGSASTVMDIFNKAADTQAKLDLPSVYQGQAEASHAQASKSAQETATEEQLTEQEKNKRIISDATVQTAIKMAEQALRTSAAQEGSYVASAAGQRSANVGLANEADYQKSLGPLGKFIDHSLNAVGSAGKAFRSFVP